MFGDSFIEHHCCVPRSIVAGLRGKRLKARSCSACSSQRLTVMTTPTACCWLVAAPLHEVWVLTSGTCSRVRSFSCGKRDLHVHPSAVMIYGVGWDVRQVTPGYGLLVPENQMSCSVVSGLARTSHVVTLLFMSRSMVALQARKQTRTVGVRSRKMLPERMFPLTCCGDIFDACSSRCHSSPSHSLSPLFNHQKFNASHQPPHTLRPPSHGSGTAGVAWTPAPLLRPSSGSLSVLPASNLRPPPLPPPP